jgi:hypothetical protein
VLFCIGAKLGTDPKGSTDLLDCLRRRPYTKKFGSKREKAIWSCRNVMRKLILCEALIRYYKRDETKKKKKRSMHGDINAYVILWKT